MIDTHKLPRLAIVVLCIVTLGLIAAALIFGGIAPVDVGAVAIRPDHLVVQGMACI